MELFTSLTRLKQELARGEPVPMTPVPLSAQALIDPAFTIGHGALEEHETLGLRCPVRGCGVYRHDLSAHLSTRHRDVGGAAAVRDALEIPKSAALCSQGKQKAMKRGAQARKKREGVPHLKTVRATSAGERRVIPSTARLAGRRNLRDSCEAQLREKLATLQKKLGRSPSIMDVTREYGVALVETIRRNYGTWDNGKAQLGFALAGRPGRPILAREAVLRGVRAFYDMHGRFPTRHEADDSERAPLICSAPATLRAMKATAWREAMHAAAVELDLYHGDAQHTRASA